MIYQVSCRPNQVYISLITKFITKFIEFVLFWRNILLFTLCAYSVEIVEKGIKKKKKKEKKMQFPLKLCTPKCRKIQTIAYRTTIIHVTPHMIPFQNCLIIDKANIYCTDNYNLDRSHIIRCQYVRAVIVSTLSEALIAKQYWRLLDAIILGRK